MVAAAAAAVDAGPDLTLAGVHLTWFAPLPLSGYNSSDRSEQESAASPQGRAVVCAIDETFVMQAVLQKSKRCRVLERWRVRRRLDKFLKLNAPRMVIRDLHN
jgi:hypothetical protein